jgi:hypothetical protein
MSWLYWLGAAALAVAAYWVGLKDGGYSRQAAKGWREAAGLWQELAELRGRSLEEYRRKEGA